jgi:hypothetical protein
VRRREREREERDTEIEKERDREREIERQIERRRERERRREEEREKGRERQRRRDKSCPNFLSYLDICSKSSSILSLEIISVIPLTLLFVRKGCATVTSCPRRANSSSSGMYVIFIEWLGGENLRNSSAT